MDIFFPMPKWHSDPVIWVHHVLGYVTMRHLPKTQTCQRALSLVTLGECTTPLLYLVLWFRTVRGGEPQNFARYLLMIWPLFRGVAPLRALSLQLATDGNEPWPACGYGNLSVTIAYMVMNTFFFTKLLARYRKRAKAGIN